MTYVAACLVYSLRPQGSHHLLPKLEPCESKMEDRFVISNNPGTTEI